MKNGRVQDKKEEERSKKQCNCKRWLKDIQSIKEARNQNRVLNSLYLGQVDLFVNTEISTRTFSVV